MCGTCGCGEGEVTVSDHALLHNHEHNHADKSRMVIIEQDILAKNQQYADRVRVVLEKNNILAFNLVSSPGSGKTTLLTETLKIALDKKHCAVIEGDQQTSNDAMRIKQTGAPAIQINTGKGCHLDAHMVEHALEKFDITKLDILFIENVGNLVCPASFDLGEAHKVVILSVTEGEDKPLKYPDMFAASDIMILNKIDLLPYLNFDVDKCIEYARRVNPDIKIIKLSATTGQGMQEWLQCMEPLKQTA